MAPLVLYPSLGIRPGIAAARLAAQRPLVSAEYHRLQEASHSLRSGVSVTWMTFEPSTSAV